MPRPPRISFSLAVIGALALTLSLAACGRKGPLDPPPGGYQLEDLPGRATAVTRRGSAPTQDKQPEFDEAGRPVAPKGLKKKLPGDWLID